MCGRLAPTLLEGFCSDRCRELAASGYTSPPVRLELVAPPQTMLDCRVVVDGDAPDPLPEGVVRLGAAPDGRGELLRLAAEDWPALDGLLDLLRASAGSESVSVFTTQEFVPGGLRSSPSADTFEGGSR